MVTAIELFVEGGGDQRATKDAFRDAMGRFLEPLRKLARSKGIRWHINACGGRQAAFSAYCTAVAQSPSVFNVLLVDSEGPVKAASPWRHLKDRDGWDNPGAEDKHCHLMVQAMEAWLVADRDNLRRFYGQAFNDKALPKNPNVEKVTKAALATALDMATRRTKKGAYHKTNHAFRILETTSLKKVRTAASFCERLVTILAAEMGGSL
jgi:Domain of unknown function (DUF4276)